MMKMLVCRLIQLQEWNNEQTTEMKIENVLETPPPVQPRGRLHTKRATTKKSSNNDAQH